MWQAHYDLYLPKWTRAIFKEWKEWEEVLWRKGISKLDIERRLQRAQMAFPNALVKGYVSLIRLLTLPDEQDRHVLAAAIKTLQ